MLRGAPDDGGLNVFLPEVATPCCPCTYQQAGDGEVLDSRLAGMMKPNHGQRELTRCISLILHY